MLPRVRSGTDFPKGRERGLTGASRCRARRKKGAVRLSPAPLRSGCYRLATHYFFFGFLGAFFFATLLFTVFAGLLAAFFFAGLADFFTGFALAFGRLRTSMSHPLGAYLFEADFVTAFFLGAAFLAGAAFFFGVAFFFAGAAFFAGFLCVPGADARSGSGAAACAAAGFSECSETSRPADRCPARSSRRQALPSGR